MTDLSAVLSVSWESPEPDYGSRMRLVVIAENKVRACRESGLYVTICAETEQFLSTSVTAWRAGGGAQVMIPDL